MPKSGSLKKFSMIAWCFLRYCQSRLELRLNNNALHVSLHPVSLWHLEIKKRKQNHCQVMELHFYLENGTQKETKKVRNVSIQSFYSGTILPSCSLRVFLFSVKHLQRKNTRNRENQSISKPQKCSYNAYKLHQRDILRCKLGGTNGF